MKKALSIILSLCLTISVFCSFTAYADTEGKRLSGDVNPLYKDCIAQKSNTVFPYALKADAAAKSETVFNDYLSAAMYVRDCMVQRKDSVTIRLAKGIKDNLKNVYRYTSTHHYYTLYGALNNEISNSSADGDYLAICYAGAQCWRVVTDDYTQYTYKLKYRTTLKQENTVEAFVNSFISELKAKKLTRLELIRAVHDKICNITEYDKASEESGYSVDSDVNTAYSAIANGKTLCEGYSALFYRICRELGIPVRIVESQTHAWNIVKPVVGKYYYNIDVTWDDLIDVPEEAQSLCCRGQYYLKNDDEMVNKPMHMGIESSSNQHHNRLDYYNSDFFNTRYPVSDKSFYVENEGYGACPYCNGLIAGAEPTFTNHFYAQTTVIPTCCKEGKTVYACTDCSEGFTEYLAPTGRHYFVKYEPFCAFGCKTPNPSYKVRPTSLTKLKAGKGKVTVKWNKAETVKGYQLQYSTSKKFTKAKTVTVKKQKTVSKLIKKLKSGKKYYFRIRCYNTVSGNKLYSKWSKVKSVKVK